MPIHRRLLLTSVAPAVLLASGCAASLTPEIPRATLWNALGIPQGANRLWDCAINKHGRHPGLERKPALLRIADPALAKIDNLAIKQAQKIKAEEDLAPQKIKAIKYLATLGCEKCYGGIEEAMFESLKDCTEKVRYETVKSLGKTIHRKCKECDQDCCSEKITQQLAKMAYERDESRPDCWYEPSERIRKAAADVLKKCCTADSPPESVEESSPGEPEPKPEPKPLETPPEPKPMPINRSASLLQSLRADAAPTPPASAPPRLDDPRLASGGHDILRPVRKSVARALDAPRLPQPVAPLPPGDFRGPHAVPAGPRRPRTAAAPAAHWTTQRGEPTPAMPEIADDPAPLP